MCGGGGGGGGSTQYNWNDDMAPYWRSALSQGSQLAQTSYQPYANGDPNARIAGFTPDQQTAMNQIRLYTTDPTLGVQDPNQAQNAGIAQEAKTLNGGYLTSDPFAIQQNRYADPSSPYFQKTLQSGMDDITRNYQMATAPDTAAQFAMNGTIGGTDYDRAVAANQFGLGQQLQKYASGMQNDQYNRSAQLQEQDLGRGSQAYQDERNRMVQTLNPTQNEQALALQRAQALTGIGDAQQQHGQSLLNVLYDNFQQQRQYPYTQMDWLTGLMSRAQGGVSPNSTTQTSSYGVSPISGLLGGALIGSSLYH